MKRTLKSSKSRNGCQRCKTKRVKCDETKPACLICIANKVECPGFGKQLKWSKKHEVLPPGEQRRRSAPKEPAQEQDSQLQDYQQQETPPLSTIEGDPVSASNILDASEWPSADAVDFEELGFSNMPPEDLFPPVLTSEIWGTGVSPGFASDFSLDVNLPSIQSNGTPNDTPTSGKPDDGGNEQTKEGHVTGSSRFLETFYRLSRPGQISGLCDEDFVNHYFNNVCSLYSCFDSELNPFRTLVADTWTQSPTVYLAIQSMAVGHLSNFYPQLAPLGLQKRSQAWIYLQRDLQLQRVGKRPIETVLLSLLLLGLSAAWHQPSDVGMQYLFIARHLMQQQLGSSQKLQHGTFFQNGLMYWEMLASFVDPVPITPLPGRLILPELVRPGTASPILPHPWTGLNIEVHYALAEIGRILRRRWANSSTASNHGSREAGYMFGQADKEWAEHLERFLKSIELPSVDQIVDCGDIKTPTIDLILSADAYRFAGLIELYASFPDLLENREALPDHVELAASKCQTTYDKPQDAFLASMASHILDIVKPIAISSAACRMLTIPLVASAGQLRYPDSTANTTESSDTQNEQHEAIVQARYLVEARMLVLSRKYPQRPLLQAFDVIKEVWQRLDSGSTNSHWMEVAYEKGWQTLMG